MRPDSSSSRYRRICDVFTIAVWKKGKQETNERDNFERRFSVNVLFPPFFLSLSGTWHGVLLARSVADFANPLCEVSCVRFRTLSAPSRRELFRPSRKSRRGILRDAMVTSFLLLSLSSSPIVILWETLLDSPLSFRRIDERPRNFGENENNRNRKRSHSTILVSFLLVANCQSLINDYHRYHWLACFLRSNGVT